MRISISNQDFVKSALSGKPRHFGSPSNISPQYILITLLPRMPKADPRDCTPHVPAHIQQVADQADAHLPAGERITVSPRILRQTVLRKLVEEKGVQYAQEASGHKSDRSIWRYVKPSQQSVAAAIDEFDV